MTQPEEKKPVATVPQLPRRKMGLFDQELFIRQLLARCVMHTGKAAGTYAGDAILALTIDDMAALKCIGDTLNLFNVYRADDHVRRSVQREAERKAAKR